MTTDTFQAIEELQKDNLSKANIKEVLSLLKNKTGINKQIFIKQLKTLMMSIKPLHKFMKSWT